MGAIAVRARARRRRRALLRGALTRWWIPALCAALGAAAVRADYQAGLDAYRRGDFAAARSEWGQVVRQTPEAVGPAVYRESLYALAMLYWRGEGVPQDFAVAAVWLKQAAEMNHAGAQNKLGYLYSTGLGVPQDLRTAEKWLRRAAEQGDPDAGYNLDLLWRDGKIDAPPAAAPAAPATGRDLGEDWIREQSPDRYTIQVIAVHQPDRLTDFIAAHPDWAPFAIYRPRSAGAGALWVLVQGSYADLEAARAASRAFPDGLDRRGDLWIRKFAMIQGLIE